MSEANLYFIVLNEHGTSEGLFDNGDDALDFRARNPEIADKVIPLVDLNVFSDQPINTEEEARKVVREMKEEGENQ